MKKAITLNLNNSPVIMQEPNARQRDISRNFNLFFGDTSFKALYSCHERSYLLAIWISGVDG